MTEVGYLFSKHIVFSTLFSVFGNRMKHDLWCLIYYLPPSCVSMKTQELSAPSPFLVKANILRQYHVNSFTSRKTTWYTSAFITVSKRGHWWVSWSSDLFNWSVALLILNVSLYPRIIPFRSWSGIGFHLTVIDDWPVLTAVIFCGGRSGADDIKGIYQSCWIPRMLYTTFSVQYLGNPYPLPQPLVEQKRAPLPPPPPPPPPPSFFRSKKRPLFTGSATDILVNTHRAVYCKSALLIGSLYVEYSLIDYDRARFIFGLILPKILSTILESVY